MFKVTVYREGSTANYIGQSRRTARGCHRQLPAVDQVKPFGLMCTNQLGVSAPFTRVKRSDTHKSVLVESKCTAQLVCTISLCCSLLQLGSTAFAIRYHATVFQKTPAEIKTCGGMLDVCQAHSLPPTACGMHNHTAA